MAVSTSARSRWAKSYTWEQELERRMCLATSEDTVHGMFFNSTLEVLRQLGGAREVTVHGWPTGGLDSECEFGWQ